uniref:CRIB domain-containing protein n=1 Tax=Gopherus evgoodei TaxID=1825980 RepID=A0A8C4YIW6_9SAUR
MPAKTPIYLKTSTPKRGRKLRLRDVLSSDMISPPLGDFRHSAHIGPEGEGDMFGELSFLQGKYDLLPSLGRRLASQSTQAVGHEPAWGPSAGGYHSVLKSAVSVPVFSGAPSPEQAPPKPPRLHLEEVPGSQRSIPWLLILRQPETRGPHGMGCTSGDAPGALLLRLPGSSPGPRDPARGCGILAHWAQNPYLNPNTPLPQGNLRPLPP